MNVPPMVLDLDIHSPERTRPLRVWLPLFLLWPLLLPLALLALVLTAITDAVLISLGQPYHHYTVLLASLFGALGDARGMVIRIKDDKTTVDMTVN